jgi:hypothetical protein
MAKKQVIRLTESDLRKVIKESVNKLLMENHPFNSVIDKCDNNLNSVVFDLKSQIKELYSTLIASFRENDKELTFKAMSIYNRLTHENNYSNKIWRAFSPLVEAYHDFYRNNEHENDFDEPEDWYERNEHGDFDTN